MTDPALNTLLTSIRVLLLTVGGALAGAGVISQGVFATINLIAGSLVVVGTAIWSVWNAWVNFKAARAQAVQAGVNLVRSGAAVDEQGNILPNVGPDTTPPKPVTVESAQQIIKDFAPTKQEIAKS